MVDMIFILFILKMYILLDLQWTQKVLQQIIKILSIKVQTNKQKGTQNYEALSALQ